MRVVLLHALPLTGAMWRDQQTWLPGSTLAPTLYGRGDSILAWADGILAEVGDEDLAVVGASVGGFCALEIARLAPQQVRTVVLVGSKAGVRRDDAARDHALQVLAGEGFEAAWAEFWLPLFGPSASSEVVTRAKALARAVPVDDLVRGVRAFYDRPDLADFARTWKGRIEVISGEHDQSPPSTTSASVALAAVNGRFHLVPDAGHYVSLEQPAAFDQLLREVLSRPQRC